VYNYYHIRKRAVLGQIYYSLMLGESQVSLFSDLEETVEQFLA
jgi:hypothetical protein